MTAIVTAAEPCETCQPEIALMSAPALPPNEPSAMLRSDHCCGKSASFGDPVHVVGGADGQRGYDSAGVPAKGSVSGPPSASAAGSGISRKPMRGGRTFTSEGCAYLMRGSPTSSLTRRSAS